MLELRPYQADTVRRLLEGLRHGSAADMSDTGVGKTVTAARIIADLELPTVVVCPKSVIADWRWTLEQFGAKAAVANYEAVKVGKIPQLSVTKIKGRKKAAFRWRDTGFIVFDEAHRCGGLHTANADLLLAAKRQNVGHLLLSATLAESPLKMRAIGYSLDCHNLRDFYLWADAHGVRRIQIRGHQIRVFQGGVAEMARIRGSIADRCARVKFEDIPDAPDTVVQPLKVDLGTAGGKVRRYYERAARDADNSLTALLRARQASEIAKIDLLPDLLADDLYADRRIVVFCNFTESLELLKSKFECPIYEGRTSDADRAGIVAAFQNDRTPLLGMNIQAGGVGLSLGDLTGLYPRSTVVFPNFDAKALVQALGRVRRMNSKSSSVQRIVFAADTVEESAYESCMAKRRNIETLNDRDLI